MTDTTLFSRAATVLRRHATAAGAGPWHSHPNSTAHLFGTSHKAVWHDGDGGFNVIALTGVVGEHPRSQADAAYIALMHPPVALALADMFDDSVRAIELVLAAGGLVDGTFMTALARAIVRDPTGDVA